MWGGRRAQVTFRGYLRDVSVLGPLSLLLVGAAPAAAGPWVLPPNEALPAIQSERPVVLPKGWLELELAVGPAAPAGVVEGRWGLTRGLQLGVEGGLVGGEGPSGPAVGLVLAPLRGEAPLRGLALGVSVRAPGAASAGPLGSALDAGAGGWEGGAELEGVVGIGALRLDLGLDGALRGAPREGVPPGHRARLRLAPDLQFGPFYLHGAGCLALVGPRPGAGEGVPEEGEGLSELEGGWALQLGGGVGLNLSRGVELRVEGWGRGWSGAPAGAETKKIEAPQGGVIASFSGRLAPRRLGLRDGPAAASP